VTGLVTGRHGRVRQERHGRVWHGRIHGDGARHRTARQGTAGTARQGTARQRTAWRERHGGGRQVDGAAGGKRRGSRTTWVGVVRIGDGHRGAADEQSVVWMVRMADHVEAVRYGAAFGSLCATGRFCSGMYKRRHDAGSGRCLWRTRPTLTSSQGMCERETHQYNFGETSQLRTRVRPRRTPPRRRDIH
jgi:hypothetical protein